MLDKVKEFFRGPQAEINRLILMDKYAKKAPEKARAPQKRVVNAELASVVAVPTKKGCVRVTGYTKANGQVVPPHTRKSRKNSRKTPKLNRFDVENAQKQMPRGLKTDAKTMTYAELEEKYGLAKWQLYYLLRRDGVKKVRRRVKTPRGFHTAAKYLSTQDLADKFGLTYMQAYYLRKREGIKK